MTETSQRVGRTLLCFECCPISENRPGLVPYKGPRVDAKHSGTVLEVIAASTVTNMFPGLLGSFSIWTAAFRASHLMSASWDGHKVPKGES